jgi:hypothetical protein
MYLFNSYKEFYVANLLKFVPFIFFRSKYIIEPSIMRIENLEFGRYSFGGCNPEIEVPATFSNLITKLKICI